MNAKLERDFVAADRAAGEGLPGSGHPRRALRAGLLAAFLLLSAGTAGAAAADLPDSLKTPGAARDITVEELCSTSTRPYRETMEPGEKKEAYHRYGLEGNCDGYCSGPEGCEIDHLIPLELGGANDIRNLWPEPFDGTVWNAHVKDRLETFLHRQVCENGLSLRQAQNEIASNWIEAYRRYLGEPQPPRRPRGKLRCE
jgi:hypothetical protein